MVVDMEATVMEVAEFWLMLRTVSEDALTR
jgi:hypothetical protein